ncbi:MAG TPA: endonuclease III [Gemmatimonadaceae bacterium]|nr:endonuclease III [Gemmatimonadaceae bacterium]
MSPARKPAARKPAARKPAARRAAESPADRRARAAAVYRGLRKLYPGARCELDFRNAFELAVATVLSAQCTDKRVNLVTPVLFARFPDAAALAAAPIGEVEDIIRSTGFFRNKARSITGLARAVVADHGGALPDTMDALVTLPGIGRKTANVVLGNAFGKNEGVVVDTHVGRLATRLGFSRHTDPVKVEADLAALFPRRSWTMLAHLLIWHGRRVCDARKPRCTECGIARLCPSASFTR